MAESILGISCYYHDAAAAIIQDGWLTAAAAEERFTREKHDVRFPSNAIRFCFDRSGIDADELDYVVFYEKPLRKFGRILQTTLSTYPKSWRTFGEAMIAWFDEKLWIKEQITESLSVSSDRVLFSEHHLSHAASSFLCSPFSESAILTLDGVGEWTTTAVGYGTADWPSRGSPGRNKIVLDREIQFPHSLGLLYSAFTAWLGFRVNNGEYKVMGMASYGNPEHLDKLDEIIDVAEDGSFWLNMDYFNYHYSPERSYSARFTDLFGPARERDSYFATPQSEPDSALSRAELEQNQYYADVAASLQHVTEEVILRLVQSLHDETGLDNLCMAGGVALNSVANGRVAREGPFENVYIQPAAGDSGGAVGAALYTWHVLLDNPREFVMDHAFYGEDFDESRIRGVIQESGRPFSNFEDTDALIDRVVGSLTEGNVVGWYQGRFEWGPRALGNRSILADPRRPEMKQTINEKVKFREPFRPFAPVVLEEHVSDLFKGIADPRQQYPTRFMLQVHPWKREVLGQVPAVNHHGTGRIQSIRREWNPRYYDLVRRFGEVTGVPVLLNTSFNLRGEPIVNTPEEALSTFEESEIDVLVMGDFVVQR